MTPHGLRYTYCSLLIAQGEDVATVAAQMRHSDPTTTLRVYTQVMRHMRHGVAQRLDEAIWGDSGRNPVANDAPEGVSEGFPEGPNGSRMGPART